jgi:hypothetical protein
MRRTSWVRRIAGLTGVLFALAGAVRPAWASSADVYNGNSFTADGVLFSFTGCTDIINSGSSTSCSTSTNSVAKFVLGTGVDGADFTIEGVSGGSLFSNLSSGKTDELKFTLTVNATPSTPVNFAQLSAITSGSGSSSSILASEAYNGSTILSLTAAGVTSVQDPTTMTSQFMLNYDIKLVQGAGGTLVLSSVTSLFTPAPEPLSLSVLAVGLAGLGIVRRRRNKARQTA